MERSADALLLSRHMPARFDVEAETHLPAGLRRGALAHEIRKDMWRALQGLRGFSPAVLITKDSVGLVVRAGGAVFGRSSPKAQTNQRIADVLARPDLRARWIAHAARSCKVQATKQERTT